MRISRTFRDWRGLSTAAVATAALATTAVVTLGGFSGTVTNPTNAFSSGTLQLKEGVGAVTCYSTGTGAGGSVTSSNTNSTCSGDDLGGKLLQVPGGAPQATTITLTNVGNTAASTSNLLAGLCSQAASADDAGYVGSDASFCGKVDVTINNNLTNKCVFPSAGVACTAPTITNTLATLASQNIALSGLAAGASATYTITVGLDSSATNADQGLTATVPLTWSITQ